MFWINRYGIDWKNDTQKQRMKKVLYYYDGKEISVWTLIMATKIAHHTEIIRQLRKDWYNIVNRTEWKWQILHSYYKLITE